MEEGGYAGGLLKDVSPGFPLCFLHARLEGCSFTTRSTGTMLFPPGRLTAWSWQSLVETFETGAPDRYFLP